MNGINEILKRLLKLFPVKLIKTAFSASSVKQEDILTEIVQANSSGIIKNFVLENFNFTRQHVYVFTHDISFSKIASMQKDFFPFDCFSRINANQEVTFFYLFDLAYKVVILNPLEETRLKFSWPFKISLRKGIMTVQFTIIEKNINSYYPDNRQVIDAERETEEEQIIEDIVSSLKSLGTVEICDLNRGIKKLWSTDIIDSIYVKWRKDKSVTTEAMDKTFTLKKQYPSIYADLITRPLGRTIFAYLSSADEFCDHFTIEPTDGKISIPIFPNNINHIPNVIGKIIQNN